MVKNEINILIHGLSSVQFGIIRKLKESKSTVNIFIISNNQINDIECTYIGNPKEITFRKLKECIKKYNIDFAIIFNELYSALGITDYYINTLKLPIIGIPKNWFFIEASKISGKNFMLRNNIETPNFTLIKNQEELNNAISHFGLPIVLKNNFLQGGFGSYICSSKISALKVLKNLLKKYQFCIAEKFISGKEISQQYLWDKHTLLPLLPVKDFKKTEKGINTGGLGSYTPIFIPQKEQELLNEYNHNLAGVLKREEAEFTGIFTANLLFAEDKIYTLEYNMRPGITEFETLIEHLDCDLAEVLYNCATECLENTTLKYKQGITGCLVVAHKSYCCQKTQQYYLHLKKSISPADNYIKLNFNVYSCSKNKTLINTKKHFLSIISNDKVNPFNKIYKYIETLDTKDCYYRKDIDIENEKERI